MLNSEDFGIRFRVDHSARLRWERMRLSVCAWQIDAQTHIQDDEDIDFGQYAGTLLPII